MNLSKIPIWKLILAVFLAAAGYLLLFHGSSLSHYFFDEDDFAYVSIAMDRGLPDYIFSREYLVQEFPRPVTHLYFWLVARVAGQASWPFFLMNLFLYAGSTVLVFRLLYGLYGSVVIGLLTGAFYLFSPCATDNLFWAAAGATGFLSGFLMLLTVNIYISSDYKSGYRLKLLAWIVALLAMGSKESALVIPLVITLLDFALNRTGTERWKRLLPFYVIASLMALNVVIVQLSYSNSANFTRYGLSWMILRNLLHFILYPLVAVFPPDPGRYTVLKMVIYPILWISPIFLGTKMSRKLLAMGILWIVITSLSFLPWSMAFQGLLPQVCDIPSRYFNLPSIGAGMIAAGFIWMLHRKWGRVVSAAGSCLLLVPLLITGVGLTREKAEPMVDGGYTAECLVDTMLYCWNGHDDFYVGSFGFRPFRIGCYNRMYFDGRLIQMQDFPVGVPAGTMMLRGPKTRPRLFIFNGSSWYEERTFESCVRSDEP